MAVYGYDGDRFRVSLLLRRILPIIPHRVHHTVPEHYDYLRNRDRKPVKRISGKLKQQRECHPLRQNRQSFLNLADTHLWLKSFVNTT